MFTQLFGYDTGQSPREGELFKVIRSHGRSFEIRYGFYEERDRHSPFAEPMAIYPDFLAQPDYTDDGMPFVTAIQHPCHRFTREKDENSTCEDCGHYRQCEELIGLCVCPENRKI